MRRFWDSFGAWLGFRRGAFQPRLTRRQKVVRRGTSGLAVAVIVAGITYPLVPQHDSTCVNRGMTLVEHEGPSGECVGFTDGTYIFDPALASVEQTILQENQRVVAAHPTDYVSVVYLLPISSAGGSILSMTNAQEQLRGAYTAQYYANRNDVDGSVPYIQLLIGSDGYQADQGDQAAQFIINAVPTQHVAAVAGFGLSLATTQSAIRRLTGAGVPVVGATLTADTLDNIKDMIRISPANADGISVAVSYIRTLDSRALIVEDQNTGDTYNATLIAGFEKFPDGGHQIIGKETFDSTPLDTPTPDAVDALKTRIDQMRPDICDAQPAAVLFGGRGEELAWLVSDLADRPCSDKPITIITGDDVTNATIDANVRKGLASGVTVDYAGIAHPDEWSSGTDTSQSFADGRHGFEIFHAAFQQQFPATAPAGLTDGNTMAAYDATLTSVSAIRLTAQPQPAPGAVSGELGALQRAHQVFGASGPLSFTADYTTSTTGSNPVGKAVPILRLVPDGSAQFVELEWPGGRPPLP